MRTEEKQVLPISSRINQINRKSNRVARLDEHGKSPFRLLIASPSDHAAIDRLRIDAYNGAGYFKIPQPERVMTVTDPANSFCFIVTDGEQIAATMRVAFAASRAEGSQIIETAPPQGAVRFPAVALCRGATDKAFRGLGLMTFLVSMGISVAYRARLQSAIAIQAAGTPHFGAMVRAGWQSLDVSASTSTDVSFESAQMKLVYLAAGSLADSHRYSEREHADLREYMRAGEAISQGVRRLPTGVQDLLKSTPVMTG